MRRKPINDVTSSDSRPTLERSIGRGSSPPRSVLVEKSGPSRRPGVADGRSVPDLVLAVGADSGGLFVVRGEDTGVRIGHERPAVLARGHGRLGLYPVPYYACWPFRHHPFHARYVYRPARGRGPGTTSVHYPVPGWILSGGRRRERRRCRFVGRCREETNGIGGSRATATSHRPCRSWRLRRGGHHSPDTVSCYSFVPRPWSRDRLVRGSRPVRSRPATMRSTYTIWYGIARLEATDVAGYQSSGHRYVHRRHTLRP